MKKTLSGLVAAIAVMAVAGNASAQVVPTGAWASESPFTYSMGYGGGAGNGTYLYYVGGYYGLYELGCQRFDPVTNANLQRANLPYYTAYNGVTWANGYLWTFGSNYSTGIVYRLDDSANTWSNPATLTNHAYGCAAVTLGSYVYIVGGPSLYTACTRFDPVTLTQTTMATMPASITYPLAAAEPLSGKVYVMNGASLYEFTPPVGAGTGSWTTRASCPTSMNSGAMFHGKGRVFAIYNSTLQEYFPGGNQWIQRANCPTSIYGYPRAIGCAFNSTKAHVWGYQYGNGVYEYTYPNYGSVPNDATAVQQIGSLGVAIQAGSDPNAGWTNASITFSANITDPDAAQLVALEVQVKRATDLWTAAFAPVSSSMGPQGVRTVVYPIPADGDYDWRYRAMDDYYNYNPNVAGVPTWHEFNKNTVTPDFRSDQVAPTAPGLLYPVTQDVNVPSLISGDVPFSWSASTDNGPATAITYDIEIAYNDSSFGVLAASQTGIVPTNVTLNLAVGRYDYSYRLRSKDIGGNYSAWSTVGTFRVVGDDGLNHSAGDAKRVMGCSALAGTGSMAGALAGLVLAGLAAARSFRRK